MRILRRNRRSAILILLATLLLATGAAWAWWAARGSGHGSGQVGSLGAPSGAGASSPVGFPTVNVSWTASAPVNGLAPTGYYAERWSGSTGTVGGGACGTPATPVKTTSCTDTPVADGSYTYTVVAVYGSWTAESTHSASVTVANDTTPPATTLATSPVSPEGSGGWFKQTSVSFTLSAADSGSGVAETFYRVDGGAQQTYKSAVAIATEGDHTVTYWSIDKRGNEETHHQAHVKLDTTAPQTTIALQPSSPDGTNGWYKTAPAFTLSATDAASGIAATSYKIDGGTTQSYTGTAVALSSGQHTVAYWSADAAGNVESTHTSSTIKIDTAAPSDALSIGASPSHAYLSGTTLYYGSAFAGSFTLSDSVSDSGSGPASASFPALSATGWTHLAQTVTTPAGGPFASSTYSWSAGAAVPSATERTVTSADAAGNTSAGQALSFVADTVAPTSGALIVNGIAAGPGGSTSTSASTSFAISTRTDYKETQGPEQSGLASSVLTIQSATLAKNTCGAPGSGGAYTSATPISNTTNPAIADGYCYLYTLTGTDNVGNAASISTTVKVDTTPPSAPTVTLSAASGNTYVSGTTAYINPQGGKSGSFIATGSSSDGESGIATISLPALGGFSSGGGTLNSPFETTYKWSNAVSAAGAQSVTATNGSGLTATNATAFTVVADTTPPSSAGTVTVPARVNATSVSVTFSGATDAGSGISTAGGELLRAEATYTVGTDSCGSFSSFLKVGSVGPTSPATDATVANNKCYEYEYKASDNVGNTTTSPASGTVKVDTTPPSLTGISSTNGNGVLETGDVLTLTFSEPIAVGSVPATGTLTQSREGNNAAKLAITGITGTEAWSTGDSEYQAKNTTTKFNEKATVSGATVSVTVGTNLENPGTAKAGTSHAITGVLSSGVTDLAGNPASSTPFSITARLW